MKRILAALVASTALMGAAQAADLATKYPVKAPVVVPVFSWTGFYVGGNVGYGWANFDADGIAVNGSPVPGSWSLNPDGFFAGGQIGYNYQFSNNVVLGIETDLQWADFSDDVQIFNYYPGNVKVDYFGTIRARLGYAFDRYLPYITGGAAYAHVKTQASYGPYSFSDSNTQWGWTIGAGVEYAFTNNWTAKLEYLYLDFGSADANWDFVTGNTSVTASTLKLGVNYKF